MNQKTQIALRAPTNGSADQVSHNGEWLRAVALYTVDGETCAYTGQISSITYVRSTELKIPSVYSATWDMPTGALGSGLRAILLPDGRVQDASCLWIEWPSFAASECVNQFETPGLNF